MRKIYKGVIDSKVALKGISSFIHVKEELQGESVKGFIPLAIMDGRKAHLTAKEYNKVLKAFNSEGLAGLQGETIECIYTV